MNDDSTDISSLNTSRLQQHNGSFAQDHVDPITITANDAILTKVSTSQMGYYSDPFLPFLAKDAVGLTSSSSAISTRSCLDKVSTRSPSPLQRHDNLRPILKQQRTTQMHQPVIRRGTHARVCVIDYAITNFLSLCRESSHYRAGEQVQIVILGSGRDTTYLRSQTRLLHTVGDGRNRSNTGTSTGNRSSSSSRSMQGKVKWYEVDHASVIENKHDILCSCPLFDFVSETILGNSSKKEKSFKITPKRVVLEEGAACDESSTMHTIDSCPPLDPYYLISYNLLHSFESLLQDMEQHHDFDRNVPTLFIMECVQMYLPQRNSCDILQTITGACRYPFIAIFDPIIQNDSFGKVMAQNLTKARITDSSMSLLQTRTLKEQVDKLSQCGFENVTGCDFYGAYEMVLSMEDRHKANRLEMLDEIEEWILIMRHYCFLVASTGGKIISSNVRDEDEDGSIPIKAMLHAYCSVEEGNIFGFSKQKCMTTTAATTVATRKRRNS